MSHIILIEPDVLLGRIYSKALRTNKGGTVETVNGAQDAIMSADKKMPDLVIVELQLIEHSGIEFLYEFRSYPEWQDIPVIINTIVPFSEFRDNWHLLQSELNVKTYLYKPATSIRDLKRSANEFLSVAA
ncbi:MAG: response regulator [Candidatus Saccharimonadales bacterium]